MSELRLPWLALLALVLSLTLSHAAVAWGTSVHHDHAIIISNALRETPSIPGEIKENICTDTIYAASLAPDDWRDVTGEWGTWQYNMAENAYYEFQRIENAWANGDYDNAIARIGIVLHYVGDAIEMAHSGGPAQEPNIDDGVRDWYRAYIEPLGSDSPLWEEEESGKGEYSHQVRHQMEAYTDSDSAWYPRRPEKYGTADDGSLDWFLNNYFYDVEDSDFAENDGPPPGFCDTVMEWHIAATSPYVDWAPGPDNDKVDNRWFYWVRTRDPTISKMDADNTIRLVYNGVYRALRDGEWRRQGNPGNPPTNWSYWDLDAQFNWSGIDSWLSLSDDLYGTGMDTVRWYHGQSNYGATEREQPQEALPSPTPAPQTLLAGAGVMILIAFAGWWRSRRKAKSR